MKIVQISCVYPPYRGGIGRVAEMYARLAHGNAGQSAVITPDYGDSGFDDPLVDVKRLKPIIKYGHGACLPQVLYLLNRYDIVHLHYPFFGTAELVWLAKLIRREKFKLILHYHMDVPHLPGGKRIFSLPSDLILPGLVKIADAVTCASFDYIKNSRIKGAFLRYQEKFFEIPFGVDTAEFKPGIMKQNNAPNFLFVGGLDQAHNFKGVDVLIKAFIQADIPGASLTIVGGGDMTEYYEEMARQGGGIGRINFAGRASNAELAEFYRSASALVLPSVSQHEAFGLVLLEAMASGTPVIASLLPGVRTVFADGRQGYYAEPGNAADLAEKLKLLAADESARISMGREARRLVEEKYSLNHMRDGLLNIYQALVK